MSSFSIAYEVVASLFAIAGILVLCFLPRVTRAVVKRYEDVGKRNAAQGLPTPQESRTVPGRVFIAILAVLAILIGGLMFWTALGLDE